ncbi:hypothetical protein PUR71_00690 [Streptomyces sp. SP17BM10]|uniref:hypothetical protein n=1 Tax=Streptomyces sp. SP17BM10 TaxID=3002530 RepID=UPI002E79017E|nr:hypothetical protein [Streptomyces sp. SP17BM10]MEE1781465.1 hypothetical protein [Streptomyces sp. SP17BM10]
MSLHEAEQHGATSGFGCLDCDYYVRATRQYPATDYPVINGRLARRWQQHVDDGECPVGVSGDT